jgi:hypothetical protein
MIRWIKDQLWRLDAIHGFTKEHIRTVCAVVQVIGVLIMICLYVINLIHTGAL